MKMTTLALARVKRLITEDGYGVSEAARAVGVADGTVRYWLRKEGVRPSTPRHKGRDLLAQYAAYRRKDETLVAVGTVAEVARACGLTVGSVWTAMCRGKYCRYEFVRIEEDDLC